MGVHRRRAALGGLSEALGRLHPLAGRGPGPRASTKTIGDMFVQIALQHRDAGPQHGPGAQRADQRRVDRSLAALPEARRRLPPQLEGDRRVVRWRTHALGHGQRGGSSLTVAGDYFVFALPMEDVIDLITPEMIAPIRRCPRSSR